MDIQKLLNSKLIKNTSKLASGTIIAQAITVLISPLLTRLYLPEDFAILAWFMSISSVVSIISTGRYEQAIVLPKLNGSALQILVLSSLIVLLTTFLSFIAVLFFDLIPKTWLTPAKPLFDIWIYLIPINVLLLGLGMTYTYWMIRKNRFTTMSSTKISRSFFANGFNIVLGVLKWHEWGLLIGTLMGNLSIVFISFFDFFKKDRHFLRKVRKVLILRSSKRYIDFPKYNIFQSLFDSLRDAGIIFILTGAYHHNVIGIYFFAQRIISVPINFLASTMSQTILKEIAQRVADNEGIQNLFRKIVLVCFFMAGAFQISVVGFHYFGIWDLIFSEKWLGISEYILILSFWVSARMITSPISSIPVVLRKLKTLFIIGSGYNIVVLGSLISAVLMRSTIQTTLIVVSAFSIVYLFFFALWIYWQVAIYEKRLSLHKRIRMQ